MGLRLAYPLHLTTLVREGEGSSAPKRAVEGPAAPKRSRSRNVGNYLVAPHRYLAGWTCDVGLVLTGSSFASALVASAAFKPGPLRVTLGLGRGTYSNSLPNLYQRTVH